MDPRTIDDILSGRRRGVLYGALRGGLLAASLPYSGLMRLRRWAYRRNFLSSYRVEAPVICVGNITAGGTGKTPMVAWLVRQLETMGRKPAILTRGYKAVGGQSDEARLLEDLCGVKVVVNADRVAGARWAIRAGADVLVMDDGFQHRRLGRDLDIVLVDATNPFGYGHCIPRGLLRELPTALAEAQALVITRTGMVDAQRAQPLRERLTLLAPQACIVTADHEPIDLVTPGGSVPLSSLSGRRVLAFCGLGNPAAFFESLRRLGCRLVHEWALPDHAAYDSQVLETLRRRMFDSGAELAVTTQKDAVKLPAAPGIEVWTLRIQMQLGEGCDDLRRLLGRLVMAR